MSHGRFSLNLPGYRSVMCARFGYGGVEGILFKTGLTLWDNVNPVLNKLGSKTYYLGENVHITIPLVETRMGRGGN